MLSITDGFYDYSYSSYFNAFYFMMYKLICILVFKILNVQCIYYFLIMVYLIISIVDVYSYLTDDDIYINNIYILIRLYQ